MRVDSQEAGARRAQLGFTLIEVLVVVAVIGMLASMAIPALKHAMYKTKRNAAIQELKVLGKELQNYHADKGAFPDWGMLDTRNLRPLTPKYLPRADGILHNLEGRRLWYYITWNFFDEPFSMDAFTSPSSYLICAQLEYDKNTWFYMSDSKFYVWKDGELKEISEMLN